MISDSRIQLNDVSYSYEEQASPALSGVSAVVQPGEFVAVLGHNGSGKSTLAKLLNALYVPTEGNVVVCGYNTREEKYLWEIRQRAGMIFQNPDNQIVATVVKEDVAFGLENLGVPTEEMLPRIESALSAVRMSAYADKAPHMLSGGQKQRVAIAGVIAMHPACVVLDEPTAMLDPRGREEVISTVTRLNRERGITVVLITHHMSEVVGADRVIVMHEGGILLDGTPRQVLSRVETLRKAGLDVPQTTDLLNELNHLGWDLPLEALTVDECAQAIWDRLDPNR